MIRETSAGGVIFHRMTRPKGEVDAKILLIKDSYGRWALPKGHVEKGETLEQAALRECSEETGIPAANLRVVDKLGEIKYFYQLKGDKIFKVVTFFLIESITTELKIQNTEIEDACWFTPKEALAKNEYKNSTEIVKKAIEKIKELV